jgi:aryl carrier-like protein
LLRGAKFDRFIPDLNWNIIEKDVGLSTCARHLATYQGIDGGDKKQDLSELLDTILSIVDVSVDDFSKEVPFTAYGLDSLGAMRLTEAIRPYTNVSQMQLLGGMTWKQLEEKMKLDQVEEPEAPSTQPMLDAVAKFSKDFSVHKASAPAPQTETVLLTGSTGAVGSSALTQLVDDPVVSKIYAVNRRSSDGKPIMDRQRDALLERGFDASYANSAKVVLLEADFSRPDFGFEPVVLEEIRSSITHIAHIGTVSYLHVFTASLISVLSLANQFDCRS